MEALEKSVRSLVSVIKKTDVYKQYKKQEEILKSDSRLWERVYQFRMNNCRKALPGVCRASAYTGS